MLIEDWSIAKVRPYPNNPRVLRNAAEKVAESIKEFGWRQPIVVDADPTHRMMSTIRHNRARGTHAVLRMAEIVRSMVEAGLPAAEICARLGMEDEELDRLLDRSGMTVRGTAGVNGFGRAWVPGREG